MCQAVQEGALETIHNVSRCHDLAILQRNCLLFPRTQAGKLVRFQQRKVTAQDSSI